MDMLVVMDLLTLVDGAVVAALALLVVILVVVKVVMVAMEHHLLNSQDLLFNL